MFENKDHIIFDLDGTLIDTIGMWNNLDLIFLDRFGVHPENIHKEREDFIHNHPSGSNLYLLYNQYLIDKYNIVGYTPIEIEKERRRLGWDYQANIIDLKPGAADFLKKSRRKGYTLTLATISTKEQIYIYSVKNQNIRKQISFQDVFNGGILTVNDVKKSKPNPEIYETALRKANKTKEESMVIEDSLNGVKASKKAGITTTVIYDKYANHDREQINALADYEVKDYYELIKKI